MDTLVGKVVLITGASKGLGAALAEAFAAAGARVAICARTAPALERVAASVRGAGADCLARAIDVRDDDALRAWVAAAHVRWGRLDVLINNASVLGPRTALAEYPIETWRQTFEVNLHATLVATQAALPAMREAAAGVILNVSSGAAIPPRGAWGAYGVSKSAVDALTANHAHELRASGVRVHAVDPGGMRTDMRAAAYPDEDPGTPKPAAAATGVFLWLARRPADVASGERFRADRFAAP